MSESPWRSLKDDPPSKGVAVVVRASPEHMAQVAELVNWDAETMLPPNPYMATIVDDRRYGISPQILIDCHFVEWMEIPQ
jgi:hypothetical protein